MSAVDRAVRTADEVQQRRPWAALPIAVLTKYGDDNGGNLAALLAYYAFVSLFPLLLVFATVIGYVLHDSPGLRQKLLDSALADFPLIGPDLRTGTLQGHWYVIVISVVISLWGARGVANAAQNAFNTAWTVPYERRPGFLPALGRSFALLGIAGVAVIITGLLSGLGNSENAIGWVVRTGAFLLSTALSVGVFLLGFRLATARDVPLREMARSAIAAAVIWQGLLAAGTFLLSHQVRHAQELYGIFGIVLGLLAWLNLQAQLTLFAVEADVVRSRRLWPRSILQPPLTRGDRRAYRAYAESQRRRPADEQEIDVQFQEPDEKPEAEDATGPDRAGI